MAGRGKGKGKYPRLTIPRQPLTRQGTAARRNTHRKSTTSATTRRSRPRTSRKTAISHPAPGGNHGRAEPYEPTPQPDKRYKRDRGNTPAGVSYEDFDRAYNAVNCSFHKGKGKEAAKEARDAGTVRDLAIDKLIRKGVLPYHFIDDDI
ncbi:hypothetical protein N431DRAFT_189745 [Stipitochalara longipes BDJ]|nr:hypothetical protein N431DRAFT_189745 [Stipitochalara longipes BDJ]